MNFLRFLVFFFLFSCEDNFQEIQNINSKNTLPVGITENLKLIYTDSAKVKAILYSSLNKDFTNKIFPYSGSKLLEFVFIKKSLLKKGLFLF